MTFACRVARITFGSRSDSDCLLKAAADRWRFSARVSFRSRYRFDAAATPWNTAMNMNSSTIAATSSTSWAPSIKTSARAAINATNTSRIASIVFAFTTAVSHAFQQWCVALRFTHPTIQSTVTNAPTESEAIVTQRVTATLCTRSFGREQIQQLRPRR